MKEEPDQGGFDRDAFVFPLLNSILRKTLATRPLTRARPQYAWGVLHAAHLAKAIGTTAISVVEFGVAGGVGLLALEQAAESAEAEFGLGIDVYGFDTGTGLPKPGDYRDCPNLYAEGTYAMDLEKLRGRLRRGRLVLGLVRDTVPQFLLSDPAPVAFLEFDLDLYSSTMDAFRLLDADARLLLPRIQCYFDDIVGFTFGDFNGERLAISDFNSAHETRKISPQYGIRHFVPAEYSNEPWVEQLYMVHIFDHPSYGVTDGLVRHASSGIDSSLNYRTR